MSAAGFASLGICSLKIPIRSPALAVLIVVASLAPGLSAGAPVLDDSLARGEFVANSGLQEPTNPPAADSSDDAAKQLERLRGHWMLVTSEREGSQTKHEEGDFALEFRGRELIAYEESTESIGGTIEFREGVEPRRFDLLIEQETDGASVEHRISFAYRFIDEDHLQIAFPRDDSIDNPSKLVPQGFDTTAEAIEVNTFVRQRK